MYDRSPIPVFPYFVLQNIVGYKNRIKYGVMFASLLKWRDLGHFQLLPRAVSPFTMVAESRLAHKKRWIIREIRKRWLLRDAGAS